MYDLKQASKLLYKRLFKFLLEKHNIQHINTDYHLFDIFFNINGLILNIFINDIKVIRVIKLSYMKKVNTKMALIFEIIDLSHISFYLRLKVEVNFQERLFNFLQLAYIEKVLEKYHLYFAKSYNILMKERILFLNKGLETSQAKRKLY